MLGLLNWKGATMLRPPDGSLRRERILLMGAFGTGKTTNWLNIAKWAHATESPARFYAIDTDSALEAFLGPGTQYSHLDSRQGGNIQWAAAYDWEEYEEIMSSYSAVIGPDDWLIIDFISPAWEAVQSWYVNQVFKQDAAEYFLEARKAMKGGNPLDGWKDWQYINKVYKRWIDQVIHRTGGHKLFTAQVKSIQEGADRATRAMFGAHGVMPAGQKQLGYQVHTILLNQVTRQGAVTTTTVKDRERPVLTDASINEFTIEYLVNVAGWQL